MSINFSIIFLFILALTSTAPKPSTIKSEWEGSEVYLKPCRAFMIEFLYNTEVTTRSVL